MGTLRLQDPTVCPLKEGLIDGSNSQLPGGGEDVLCKVRL